MVRLAVAVLVGAAVPLALRGQDAAAATVTCPSVAHVFDVRYNGDLWLYDHTAPVTGAFTWTNVHQIGSGFTGTILAGAGGDIYRITGDGALRLYNFTNNAWTNAGGTVIGQGFQQFNPSMITVDSAGHIFAVNQNGVLLTYHYNDATASWDDAGGTELDLGWDRYVRIAASGDDVVYAVDRSGTLFRYRYDQRSQRWTDYGRPIGSGFSGPIFSPGGDVLYLRDTSNAGLIYWYHFNDDTGTWDNGGTGRLVAEGFDGSIHPTVTAGPDACAVPAPAPVPAVTPDPAPADAPIAVADGDLFYTDQSGHVIVAESSAGSSQALTFQLGTMVTAAPISAVSSGNAIPAIAVLDSTGQVWFNPGSHGLTDFTSVGGYLKAVRLIPSSVPNGSIDLVGVDAAGGLWQRQGHSDVRSLFLFPWRPLGITIAPGTPSTDLPDLDSVTRAVGTDYGVGNTANGNAQIFDFGGLPPNQGVSLSVPVGNLEVLGVGEELQAFPTAIGYDATAGQPYF